MIEHRQATLARLAQPAMDGILAASRAGDGASYIDPDLARQGLVACLASIVDADDRVKTRRDMREAPRLLPANFSRNTWLCASTSKPPGPDRRHDIFLMVVVKRN